MKRVRTLDQIASRQHGVVAVWQLREAGWSRKRVQHRIRELERLHDGVYLTGAAPPTQDARWWAATLTTPDSVLSHFSAAAFWGLRRSGSVLTVVTRPGRSESRRHGELLVHHSTTLPGNRIRRDGLQVTTADRTVIDLWPALRGRSADRLLREAMRLGLTDADRMAAALDAHRGRRGTAGLRERVDVYRRLPVARCRSDAEVEGLLILDAARVPLPDVNVRRAGEEADFSWAERRLIIEVDGDAFHQDPLEDARKTRVWTRAGWEVRRIAAQRLYADPAALAALAR